MTIALSRISLFRRMFQLSCSALSAVLLALSFPNADFIWLAWVGLVPLLFVIDRSGKKGAFGYAYLAGFVFFFSVLSWIHHVTIVGLLLLTAYLSLYFGFFGLCVKLLSGHRLCVRIVVLPSIWVVLEFIRAHFLTGFGWAALGYSQAANVLLIQIADITGVGGVSFLLVGFNVLLKEHLARRGRRTPLQGNIMRGSLAFLLLLSVVLVYGAGRFHSFFRVDEPTVKVAMVQGNVPLEEFWTPAMKPGIVERYLALSRETLRADPDLIVWPESSFPNFLWEYSWLWREVRGFSAAAGKPLLLGAVTRRDEMYFNSAILVSADGEVVDTYDKIHLVLFGEYIPLRKELPWLASIVPVDDFTAGQKRTIFDEVKGTRFAVLICFEDTLPWLARRFTRAGAGYFVNITNDAWFKDSSQPLMHLHHAVFRTVENRRPLVRATNTGASCLVDARGVIGNFVEDVRGRRILVSGWAAGDVSPGTTATLYTKFGDVFTLMCFLAILGVLFFFRPKKGTLP